MKDTGRQISAHQRNTIRLELLRSRRPRLRKQGLPATKVYEQRVESAGPRIAKGIPALSGGLDGGIGDGKESPKRDVSSHICRGEFGSENISSEKISRVIRPIPVGETEAQRGPHHC